MLFQGALSIILGDSSFSLAASKSWSTISRLWPALVKCGYPEKPDVQKLIEDIKKKIEESFETLALSIEASDSDTWQQLTAPCMLCTMQDASCRGSALRVQQY